MYGIILPLSLCAYLAMSWSCAWPGNYTFYTGGSIHYWWNGCRLRRQIHRHVYSDENQEDCPNSESRHVLRTCRTGFIARKFHIFVYCIYSHQLWWTSCSKYNYYCATGTNDLNGQLWNVMVLMFENVHLLPWWWLKTCTKVKGIITLRMANREFLCGGWGL